METVHFVIVLTSSISNINPSATLPHGFARYHAHTSMYSLWISMKQDSNRGFIFMPFTIIFSYLNFNEIQIVV